MIQLLLEWLSPVRQSAVELMAQVTLWATAGLLIYLVCKRMVASCRYLLLCFCLGILGLSLLILFPLQFWNLPASWRTATSTVTSNWMVTTESETALEPSTSLSPVSAEPVSIATGFSFGDVASLVIALLALLVTASLLRWLLGLVALEHWRRTSAHFQDEFLLQQVSLLREQMGIRQSVALRVSHSLESPATIGWWRPTILLPASWTEWQQDECRAVLAHELAHVRNRDFPLWLAVQFAAALHTYHPLVRYLVRQLLGELELAADRLAAPFAGGTTHYMRTLCQLALRHGRRRAGNLTLALFPVQIPLSWRMMMLRSPKAIRLTHGIWSRLCLAGLLATLAIAISGFRTATFADEKKTDQKIFFFPRGSEHPYPNSHVVNMKVMVVEMKEADLQKLGFLQRKNVPATKFIRKSMEEIKKQLAGISYKESVPSCAFFTWSDAIIGISLVRGIQEHKIIVVNPSIADDGKSLELKSNLVTIKENGPEMAVVNQEITVSLQFGQCACFVTSCDDTDKKSGLVRVTFVSVPSVKPLKNVVFKSETKQYYEIELRLVSVRKTVIERFWNELGVSDEERIVQNQPTRIYKAISAEKLFELIHSDVKSCTLCTPRLIIEDGHSGCITTSQDKTNSLSFSCNVISLPDSSKFLIDLSQTMTGSVPMAWLGLDKNEHKINFSAVLSSDQLCCIGCQVAKDSSEGDEMMLVTVAKVNKLQSSTNPIK